MRSLVKRWNYRVTLLVGGAGFGKTTLLAQALAENRLAPQGNDLWVGFEPHDAEADSVARVVAAALTGGDEDLLRRTATESVLDPGAVADVVWRRAPAKACFVLDDVHHVPLGSTGAAWLADLMAALPRNGHVLIASRSEPPVPLARLDGQGAVLRLTEDDLRFSDEELCEFAALHGLDPVWFDGLGGWPAMAELAASVRRHTAFEYLWEEVLEPLGTMRRRVLAVLCDLGGADDQLASAAIGAPVELAKELEGVPLVARGGDGWHTPHALWHGAPGITLAPADRGAIRHRAVEHLIERGRFDEAFHLIEETALWDAAPAILRSACLATEPLDLGQVQRWLSASPETVRVSSGGRLAAALHSALTTPALAVGPLQEASARARADGDVDAELSAIAWLNLLAWWHQDLAALNASSTRLNDVESGLHTRTRAIATFASAMTADLAGDDFSVLAYLDSVESNVLDHLSAAYSAWMSGVVYLERGDIEAAEEILDALTGAANPTTLSIVADLRLRIWWRRGLVDKVLEHIPDVVASEKRRAFIYTLSSTQILASTLFSHVGDAKTARAYLDETAAAAPGTTLGLRPVPFAAATASLQLAEGHEEEAAATLREALERYGLDQGQDRRTWRHVLALSYVLIPETRAHWDAAPLRGFVHLARELAAAVVAFRRGSASQHLRMFKLPALGEVRSALHHRLAAEFAIGLDEAGRSEGQALLELLGLSGRNAVREMAATKSRQARLSKKMLAATPAPPPRAVHLAVLGPMILCQDGPDGEEVTHPYMREGRVQGLLAFLVTHRRTTRSMIIATFWPDLDDRSAANNLGVALNKVLALLEPLRRKREPGYLLRLKGETVELVTSDLFRIDVDDLNDHFDSALDAEASALPSVALDQYLAAVDLYRGDLFMDVPEADWYLLDREHYRSRVVRRATRAGQLLLARGDGERAESLARRILEIDPWSESAYVVLVASTLASGDRSGAHRLLQRCLAALADLGVEPSNDIRQLQRRVTGTSPKGHLPT